MFGWLKKLWKKLFKSQRSTSPPIRVVEMDYSADFLNEEFVKEVEKWLGVIEIGGDNKGPDVEKFQKAVDGKATMEPWCMAFKQFCIKEIEKRYNVVSRIFKTEHVLTCWNKTPEDMRVTDPKPGDLMLWNYKDTASGHVGTIVDNIDKWTVQTIEGNTSSGSKIIREGDGVYLKGRHIAGGTKFKVLGFLRPF